MTKISIKYFETKSVVTDHVFVITVAGGKPRLLQQLYQDKAKGLDRQSLKRKSFHQSPISSKSLVRLTLLTCSYFPKLSKENKVAKDQPSAVNKLHQLWAIAAPHTNKQKRQQI